MAAAVRAFAAARSSRAALPRRRAATLYHARTTAASLSVRWKSSSSVSSSSLPEPEPEQLVPAPRSSLRPLSFDDAALSTAVSIDDERARREVTLYVRGFMSIAGEDTADEDTASWRRSHAQLVSAHGWQPRALAYEWKSIGVPDVLPSQLTTPLEKLRFLPMPAVTVAAAARIATVLLRARFGAAAATGASLGPLAVGALVADVLLHATRLVAQYRQAAATSEQEAEQLRQVLVELRRDYGFVRVVAHSLGCRMLLHACQHMDSAQRPDETHLLAAAVEAAEAAPLLSKLARGETHAYFSRDDLCLGVAFRVIEGGPALGYSGLADVAGALRVTASAQETSSPRSSGAEDDKEEAAGGGGGGGRENNGGVFLHDSSEHFGLAVHNMYGARWGQIAYGSANKLTEADGRVRAGASDEPFLLLRGACARKDICVAGGSSFCIQH
jgi:hypothetical protein